MEIETPSGLLVRRGVLGICMIGLALAFILRGEEPGPIPYLIGGTLAIAFVALAFTDWQGAGWIGVLAYLILVSSFLTKEDGLLGTLLGLFLAALTAFQPYEHDEEASKPEADASLGRFQPDPH